MLKERIRELCKQQKISVTKLEETLGLGNGAIGKWDKYKPKTENLEKVADYFGVTIDYLLGRPAPTRYRDVATVIDLDSSALDKALEEAIKGNPRNERQLRRQLSDEAYSLLTQMNVEQQKTAIRLLKALADENKE